MIPINRYVQHKYLEPTRAQKVEAREKIEADVAEYLSRGGHITQLPQNMSKFSSVKMHMDGRGVPCFGGEIGGPDRFNNRIKK